VRLKTGKYWSKVIVVVLLYVAAISIGPFLLVPFFPPFGFVAWLVFAFGAVFLIVRWLAGNTVYLCPACGYEFAISTFRYFISPHIRRRKLLKCPRCGKRSWCRAMSIEEITHT